MILPFFWRDGLTWAHFSERLRTRISWQSFAVGFLPALAYFFASKLQFGSISDEMIREFEIPRSPFKEWFEMPIAWFTVFGCLLLASQARRIQGAVMITANLGVPTIVLLLGFRLSVAWHFNGPVISVICSQINMAVVHVCFACFFALAFRRTLLPMFLYLASTTLLPFFCFMPMGWYFLVSSLVSFSILMALKKANMLDAMN